MRTFAILPVKTFSTAKRRLREGLEARRREALVEAMFTDVLRSLRRTTVDQIVVVTGSRYAQKIATEHGAIVLTDDETGHNDAAALGINAAVDAGADRVLLVPGDCPVLDPEEVNGLLTQPTVRADRARPARNGHQRAGPDAADGDLALLRARKLPAPCRARHGPRRAP
jgi:2-phospho-L-lactate/phosphoenolpyruvate guanylyltransferase